jgi:uncharacterized membrane protein YfcA
MQRPGDVNALMTMSGKSSSSSSADVGTHTLGRPDKRRVQTLPWLCLAVVIISALGSTATPNSVETMVVVFVCSVVSAVAGFAFSAIAGAILFHTDADPIRVVNVLLVASLSSAIYTTWSIRSSIDWRALAPYVVGGTIAIPPGVLLLLNTRADVYLAVLGGFLFSYGAYALVGPVLFIRHDGFIVRSLVGVICGLTGALAAFPAAFLVIWCRAHNMDKHRQLAIVQPFIVLMQIMILGTLATLCVPQQELRFDLIQFVAPAILGAYAGLAIRHVLTNQQFNNLISALLLLSGLSLALRAL